ncbi:MAG: class I SAM-dependent rRNA methyltransferase [Acidobacteriota bacterium]
MASNAAVHLRRGRDSASKRRHPWIFSGAIHRVEGAPGAGDTVDVFDADGRFLGRGAYSPKSQISVRMWVFADGDGEAPEIDGAWLHGRIRRAVAARTDPISGEGTPGDAGATGSDGGRLVHAESDGLPGLVVDRYGDVLVCQFLSAGAERWRSAVVDALGDLLTPRTIWERSDSPVRAKEGLAPRTGLLAGEEPPDPVRIEEGGRPVLVDVRVGHKTGFYLDQRPNRALLTEIVGRRCSGGEVLNAFAYTGTFAVAALAGGAKSVVNVEASAPALDLARKHVELAGFPEDALSHVEGNVFSELRGYRAEGRRFDLVVLDPPKFADARSRVDKASRGYKDINLLAFQLLRPGGLLMTFSCSGAVSADLFQKIVAGAALDSRRDVAILDRLGAGDDHPTSLAFPEGSYLKGLLCRVDDP